MLTAPRCWEVEVLVEVLDSSNRAQLEQEAMQRVLEVVQAGNLVPVQSEQAVWGAFADGRADMGLIWAPRFIREPDE